MRRLSSIIKDTGISREIDIWDMLKGEWYLISTIRGNVYIFKYGGMLDGTILKELSYCLTTNRYGSDMTIGICREYEVSNIHMVFKSLVRKYFDI
jgi:hypothetical protein